MTTPPLRARTAFEIIDASVQLFRQHFATFVMLGALAAIPVWLVIVTSPLLGWLNQVQANPLAPATVPVTGVSMYGLFAPVAYLWSFVVSSSFIVAASDAYLLGTVDAVRALRVALTRAIPLLVALFLWSFAAVFGAMLLIVGMFYVFARYFAVLPAILLEHKGPIAAFHRSRDLAKDYKWRILGTLALTALMFFIIAGTLQVVVQLLPVSFTAILLLNGVVGLFVQPIMTIVLTVLYYDQRIRKEGFDLAMQAQQLAPAPVAG